MVLNRKSLLFIRAKWISMPEWFQSKWTQDFFETTVEISKGKLPGFGKQKSAPNVEAVTTTMEQDSCASQGALSGLSRQETQVAPGNSAIPLSLQHPRAITQLLRTPGQTAHHLPILYCSVYNKHAMYQFQFQESQNTWAMRAYFFKPSKAIQISPKRRMWLICSIGATLIQSRSSY